MKRSRLQAWMLAMAALALASAAHAQKTYRLEQIGPDPTPYGFHYANDMNDKGDVVGGVYGTFTGWIWHEGTLTPIPALPGSTDGRSEAFGLNDRGQVVGFSAGRPYLWHRGHLRDTGAFPGLFAGGMDINERGVFLGAVSGFSSLQFQPFLQFGPLVRALDALPGDTYALAYRINERGVVMGSSGTRAVIWKRGRIQQLGLLPGASDSIAGGINERNDVSGEIRFNGGSDSVAVIWRDDGEIVQLPSLFTGAFSRARAVSINDRGQLVGDNQSSDGGTAAVLWQNGMVYDLNDLIRADDPLRPFVRVISTLVINNRGQILVTGTDSRLSVGQLPYRLTPSGHL
jgi:probable HAF family extracellular repeat protein